MIFFHVSTKICEFSTKVTGKFTTTVLINDQEKWQGTGNCPDSVNSRPPCLLDPFLGRLAHNAKMRQPGIEPGATAWKAVILPLNY